MKRIISFSIFILASLCLQFSGFAQNSRSATQPAKPTATSKREVLTNEAIINLVKADFKEKTILSLIRTSPVAFDISSQKLIQLKKNKVNENVIKAMIERATSSADLSALKDDEFFQPDDEAFFKQSPKLDLPEMKRKDGRSNDDLATEKETNIFGSRAGGQSETRSRGGLGGEHSGSSEIGGSATIRIIKPPTEGGSEPKLVRAAKLNNQAIIDMIQAGFSEGTILRKIELTQVEFDVSPKAIAELRKNRVNDKILKAMRDAMDESK